MSTVSPDSVAQDQIKAFVERIERLEEERKAIAGDIAEVYAEAKGNGFDKKALKAVVRIRAADHASRMEHEALVELYLAALGMGPAPEDDDEDEQPHVRARAPARESDQNEDHPGGENANSVGKADASHASLRSGREEASRLAHNQEIAGSSPAPATTPEIPSTEAEEAGEGTTAASSPDTKSEPEVIPVASAPGGESAARPAAALVVADNSNVPATKKRLTFNDPAHRDCLDPAQCGGFSNLKLCQRCAEAAAVGQVA